MLERPMLRRPRWRSSRFANCRLIEHTFLKPPSVPTVGTSRNGAFRCVLIVSFACDSTLATTSADHTVNIWNMKDFSLMKTLNGHQRWVWDCVYSHDSDFLVTGQSPFNQSIHHFVLRKI
jgi:WD40 repeat protein